MDYSVQNEILGMTEVVMDSGSLCQDELDRYSRSITLPQIGLEGQTKLKKSRVAVVGTGGLGSPLTMYLAAAGIGTIGLFDSDRVDLSNLQRQIIHDNSHVGKFKTDSAQKRIREINPHVNVETYPMRLTCRNSLDYLRDFDMIIGCVDNFPSRYMINAVCVKLGKPNIYGSIMLFEGQAGVFSMPGGPCYRCFFREPPPGNWKPAPSESGIIGPLPGIIGCIQANEAIKVILGIGDPLNNRLLLFDALRMTFREVKVRKNPECPVCGIMARQHEMTVEEMMKA